MKNSGDNVFEGIRVGEQEASLFAGFLAAHDFAPPTRKAMRSDLRKFARWFTTANKERFAVPFRPVTLDQSWLTSTVTSLAKAIYAERAFERVPILADALEDAGCTNQDILNHCRQPGEHVRGCWVVDLVLGKN